MAQADPRSLEEIRRDAESARAGLTATVDQLKTTVNETASDIRHRMSPDVIKAEVSGYIKSRGEAMLDSITEAVRANPLQALAIGASVAVPALRVIRAIPVPVLMVGAGLYLAGTPKGRRWRGRPTTWRRIWPARRRAARARSAPTSPRPRVLRATTPPIAIRR